MGWTEDFCESPINIPPKKRHKPTPAKLLRNAAAEQVRSLGYLGSQPCRIMNFVGMVEFGEGKNKRKGLVGTKGSSDDVWIWFGHAFCGEAKAGADRQHQSQVKFQARVEAAGGTYILYSTPKELIDAMMRWYQINIAKLQPKS